MYSVNPLPSVDSQPQIENTVLYPCLVKSEDANHGCRGLTVYLLKKDPHISGPAQFEPVFFKGQL